jgi:ABC-type sugar transport system permease subunit
MTLAAYAYQRSFIWDSDLGAGASVVMMMFVLIASLCLVYFRVMRRSQDEFTVVR